MVTPPVTILSESSAFKVNKKIIPKAAKTLKVKVNAKNNGIKNKLICKAFASVKVWG